MIEFSNKRLNAITNARRELPVVQASAVIPASRNKKSKQKKPKSKLSPGPGKAFRLSSYWKKTLTDKGVNVKDLANLKLAVQRMSNKQCLFCGSEHHNVNMCTTPHSTNGCLPTA